MANILFQLSGSIACGKATQVISELVKRKHEVQVVATDSALRFVGTALLEGLSGRPVATTSFVDGAMMSHTQWAKWYDIAILCPASAERLNKLANGVGSDLVSQLFLMHPLKQKHYLIAPAMNPHMWQHPATQQSVKTLQKWGAILIGPEHGVTACGDTGEGRLSDPLAIADQVEHLLFFRQQRILITAGGTKEQIDDVRCLSNSSSGRSGIWLAQWLYRKGYDVTLIHHRDMQFQMSTIPKGILSIPYTNYISLQLALKTALSTNHYDICFHSAAVSDYSVKSIQLDGKKRDADSNDEHHRKISSESEHITLTLERNPKLIAQIKSWSANELLQLVGFKLTSQASQQEVKQAVQKLFQQSGCDYVIHNDLTQYSADTENRRVTLYHSLHGRIGEDTFVASLERLLKNHAVPSPYSITDMITLEDSHDLMS